MSGHESLLAATYKQRAIRAERERDGERAIAEARELEVFQMRDVLRQAVDVLASLPKSATSMRRTEVLALIRMTLRGASRSIGATAMPESGARGGEDTGMSGRESVFHAHGRTSELIEEYDATAGGEQFYVRCDCGYETPEATSENEAWALHDEHVRKTR